MDFPTFFPAFQETMRIKIVHWLRNMGQLLDSRGALKTVGNKKVKVLD
jgi:hypothetical protein